MIEWQPLLETFVAIGCTVTVVSVFHYTVTLPRNRRAVFRAQCRENRISRLLKETGRESLDAVNRHIWFLFMQLEALEGCTDIMTMLHCCQLRKELAEIRKAKIHALKNERAERKAAHELSKGDACNP